jgi:hypothetical protein
MSEGSLSTEHSLPLDISKVPPSRPSVIQRPEDIKNDRQTLATHIQSAERCSESTPPARALVSVWASRLYSNCRFLGNIKPPGGVPSFKGATRSHLSVQWVDANGKKRARGGPDLKASQAYPRGFGTALVRLFETSAVERANLAEACTSCEIVFRTDLPGNTVFIVCWFSVSNSG